MKILVFEKINIQTANLMTSLKTNRDSFANNSADKFENLYGADIS